MDDRWEARVVFNPGKITNAIYLHRKSDIARRDFVIDGGKIVKTFNTAEPKPDELEFAWLDDDQIRALMTAFDAHGIKRPDAGFTEGKLVATERHLEDMRQIVGHIKKLPLGGDKIEYRSYV